MLESYPGTYRSRVGDGASRPCSVRQPILALIALALSACSRWTAIPAPAPAVLPPERELQVWHGGKPIAIRAVVIEADTIRGERPARECRKDCRVAIPRAAADSTRLRVDDSKNFFGAGVGIGAVAATVLQLGLVVYGSFWN
jgi:hypothetical protein